MKLILNSVRLLVALAVVFVVADGTKKFYWISNNAGLFSQFLQLKIMYYVSQQMGRDLVIPPIKSKHYGSADVVVCDFFAFPLGFSCEPPPKSTRCVEELPDGYQTLQDEEFCYSGTIKFGLQTKARKYVVKAVDAIDLPMKFHSNNLKRLDEFKADMGLKPGQNFTVVHWRRGDQFAQRCGSIADQSVNCGHAEDLISKVRKNSNDSVVFVATNEDQESKEMNHLRSQGFLTFSNVGQGKYSKLDLFEILTIEVSLMMEASTFLGWGVTEINDVVEYERWRAGKTHCIDQSVVVHEEQITWCALKGISPLKIDHSLEAEGSRKGRGPRGQGLKHQLKGPQFIDRLLNMTDSPVRNRKL